jgi:hypothetical protein
MAACRVLPSCAAEVAKIASTASAMFARAIQIIKILFVFRLQHSKPPSAQADANYFDPAAARPDP